MYEQFKELADVDITTGADGGRADDALRHGRHPRRGRDAARRRWPGSSPPARSPAACTARTGSAATRSPICSCSARGPGAAPRRTRRRRDGRAAPRPGPGPGRGARPGGAARADRRRGSVRDPARPAGHDAAPGRHLPGRGRPRRRRSASSASCASAGRAVRVTGGRAFNPGWHLVVRARQPADRVARRSRAAPSSGPRAAARTAGSTTRRPTTRTGAGVNSVVARARRWHDEGRHRRRSRRCPTSCAACSARATTDARRHRCRTHISGSSAAAPARRAASTSSTCRSRRGWSSSTPSTGSRATRRPTSPCAGTARPPSAARAAPR